jgi:hypothetical protein
MAVLFMLTVINAKCQVTYDECHYTDCRYAQCRGAG